jgi:hypothetical protein
MERVVKGFFFQNWPRKIFSLVIALSIWIYVSYSITETKVFPKMPVRIVNLPPDKTVRGMQSNGFLNQRLSVTLTGTKELLHRLEKKDFEIVIDASDKGDEWIIHLDKRNLVSTNPDIDLIHNITNISNGEMILKLSKLVTEKIPVYIRPPKGEPPNGYQYLDVFPQKVFLSVTGPEEDVKKLQDEGLGLTFDLGQIKKEDLDALGSNEKMQSDEVSYQVPDSWKRVGIPFRSGLKEELIGAEAKELHINFLRKDLLPIGRNIPISVFYPLASINTLNPRVCPLLRSHWITSKNEVTYVSRPLFVGDVSRVFLDIVRDWVELVIIADSSNKGEPLRWEVQFIDQKLLEDQYVSALLTSGQLGQVAMPQHSSASISSSQKTHLALRERFLRGRFREYMQKFCLYESRGVPFTIEAYQGSSGIQVQENSGVG